MKKDKEWLLNELKEMLESPKTNIAALDTGYELAITDLKKSVIQLDEPEVLSEELPVIPQWVADNIESKKRVGTRLNVAMSEFPELKLEQELGIDEHECNELYARAWLDGYEVEKEKKYYVITRSNKLLLTKDDGVVRELYQAYNWIVELNKEHYQLTEQEIKEYDERYWAFAEEVTE